MVERNILLLKGDGSAPEASAEGVKVLTKGIGPKYGHKFLVRETPVGASAYLQYGKVVPEESRKLVEEYARERGAILKEAIGLGPVESAKLRQDGVSLEIQGIIDIRVMLDTFMAYRPAVLTPKMFRISPIRPERIGGGLDFMMFRELVGGIYVDDANGDIMRKKIRGKDTNWEYAFDPCLYTKDEVVRFARACFQESRERKREFTMVQKPNILATGAFFEYWFGKIQREEFPDVSYKTKIIDAACAGIVMKPTEFNGDTILENLQGDILTDEQLGVLGSLGFGAASCWNPNSKTGFFEATHGSAPDLTGKGEVNPYSMIGSSAFMIERVFGMKEEAADIWRAMNKVVEDGYGTRELVKKYSEVEQNARAEDDLRRLYTAFKRLQPALTREQAKKLILRSNQFADSELESKVLTTSQFGDMVVENILKGAA